MVFLLCAFIFIFILLKLINTKKETGQRSRGLYFNIRCLDGNPSVRVLLLSIQVENIQIEVEVDIEIISDWDYKLIITK